MHRCVVHVNYNLGFAGLGARLTGIECIYVFGLNCAYRPNLDNSYHRTPGDGEPCRGRQTAQQLSLCMVVSGPLLLSRSLRRFCM